VERDVDDYDGLEGRLLHHVEQTIVSVFVIFSTNHDPLTVAGMSRVIKNNGLSSFVVGSIETLSEKSYIHSCLLLAHKQLA
jgi:hypothetical protein